MADPIYPSGLLQFTDSDHNTGVIETKSKNLYLRAGTVIKVHKPSDPTNHSKNRWEYNVSCKSNRDGITSPMVYFNCQLMPALGGIANHQNHVLRERDRVLVMCLNGLSNNAVIVGASTNMRDAKEPDHEYFEWEYNGVNFKVNPDGSVKLNFLGATDNKGVAKDEKVSNTNFQIDKDGSITVDDANGQKIFIDKVNKKIVIEATDKAEIAQQSWTIEASTVRIKSPSTTIDNGGISEPTVLGLQAMAAMQELTTILVGNAVGFTTLTTPNPNAPTVLNPAIVANLIAWQAKWLAGQMLSKTTKVE